MYLNVLIFFTSIWFYSTLANEDELLIKTEKGPVRGSYRKTINGKQFIAFNGIPYAQPPVGELRFMPPAEVDSWTGILDASKPHHMCPQIDMFFNDSTIKGVEDCLYLNVYKPQGTQSKDKLLPVFFYIHGGAFNSGAATPDVYGPDILLDKSVILVTTNYRLGALGFLSTGDNIVSGNNGLKDQTFALKWTKRNIINFGGDPNKIMIFGQSAGGVSVHYHVLSPLSKDLFNTAIAHSGSVACLWAVAPEGEAIRNAKRLASLLNCPTGSNGELVDCLRKVSAHDIIAQDKEFMEFYYHPVIPFKPVVEPDIEGAFITKHPLDIIKSGEISNVPLIFGMTSEDGAIISAALYNDSKLIEKLNQDFDRLMPLSLLYDQTTTNDDKHYITSKIKKFYFDDKAIDTTAKSQLTNLYTDAIFFHFLNVATRLHVKYTKIPVYYFVFGYKGSITLTPFFGDTTYDYGVTHGDELNYILSSDLFGEYKPTKSDQKIIDLLTAMWINFADIGNPTPRLDDVIETQWVPNTKEGKLLYYFIKNENETEMVEDMYSQRAEFWNKLPLYSKQKNIKTEL